MNSSQFDPLGPGSALAETLKKMDLGRKHQLNPVSWMHERLANYIAEFENSLTEAEEVGAHLVSFGHDMVFHIADVSYHGPDMIVFYGFDDHGKRVQLIQHYSQLSVLLVALPKLGSEARRIGFRLKREAESDD